MKADRRSVINQTEYRAKMAFLYRIMEDGSVVEGWEVREEPLVVGRGELADVHIEDTALSRSHFSVVREDGDFFVEDLHSSNGTWINGKRVLVHKLQPNELISAGEALFFFSASDLHSKTGVAMCELPPRAAARSPASLASTQNLADLPRNFAA